MNTRKADLIDTIHQSTHFTRQDIGATVEAFLGTVSERMAKGEIIQIRGFGTFYTKDYKPRPARNPRNGDPHQVPARVGVKFRAAPGLRQTVEAGPILVMAEAATGEIVAAMARRHP